MSGRLLGPSLLVLCIAIAAGVDAFRADSSSVATADPGVIASTASIVAPSDDQNSTTSAAPTSTTTTTTTTTTTSTTTTTTTLAPREVARAEAEALLLELDLEQIVAQLFVVEVPPESAADAVGVGGWGGLFLKMEDYSREAATSVVADAQAAAAERGDPLLFISSDVEGGRITKMPVTPLDPPAALRNLPETEVLDRYRTLAAELCGLGVNFNLAPVGDVDEFANPVLANGRSFSGDGVEVAGYISLVIDAYRDAAATTAPVATTTKHFPGHGAASLDTHRSGAAIGAREEISARHEPPFAEAVERYRSEPGAIMIGHLTVGGGDEPATFSNEVVTEWLRTDLGHEGVVITDDLANMAAVTDRPVRDRARLALLAGIDLLLWNDLAKASDAREHIEAEVLAEPEGALAQAVRVAARRVLTLKVELGLVGNGPRCG